MRTSSTFTIISILFLFSKIAFGQTNQNIDSLICKEWKLAYYEEGGEKFPPSKEQKNDRMIFYKDHKVKSIEAGNIQNGTWKYDEPTKTLIVVDNQTKERANLKVLKITKD